MHMRAFMSPNRHPFRYTDDGFAVLQRTLQRGLDEVWSAGARNAVHPLTVRLDVHEDDAAFYVTAELPGLSEKDVEVTFDDGILTIKGEKKIAREEAKDKWHVTERASGKFTRSLALPDTVDAGKIEAKFSHGVLRIALTKKPLENTEAKKINIQVGS